MEKKKIVQNSKVDVAESLEDLLAPKNDSKNPLSSAKSSLTQNIALHSDKKNNLTNAESPSNLPNSPNLDDLVISLDSPNNSNKTSNYEFNSNNLPCPPALHSIPLTRKVFADLIFAAQTINEISKTRWGVESAKLEVYMYLCGDPQELKTDQPLRASSIYIPFHEASEARVNVNEEGILDVQKFLRESGLILLGWAHSHGHYDVFSSDTDDINHQIILNETMNYVTLEQFRLKYVYSITVIESAENFPLILTQFPCGHVEQTKATLDIQGAEYTPNEARDRLMEIKNLIEKRVTIIKPSQNKTLDENINELSEELIADFIQQLWKSKRLLFNEVPDEHESQFELIQKYIRNYDQLLVSGAEESFRNIAKKITQMMTKTKNEI